MRLVLVGEVDTQHVGAAMGRKQNDHFVLRLRKLSHFIQNSRHVFCGGIGPIGWLAKNRVVEFENHSSRVYSANPGFGGEHVTSKRFGLRVHRKPSEDDATGR